MTKYVNVKESFVELLRSNEICDGRIITNPFRLPTNQIQVSMSFNDINQFEDEFTFYDDNEDEDRGDDSGILELNFNNVEKVIYFIGYDRKFSAMLYFEDSLQVEFAFNLKNQEDIPLQWDTAVSKGSLFRINELKNSEEFKMNREKFINLMKQGNKVILDGMLELNVNGNEINNIEFDDIYVQDNRILFSYMDHANNNDGWRAERTPTTTLEIDNIINVEQKNNDNTLFGKYLVKISIQNNMEFLMWFDVIEGTDAQVYGVNDGFEVDYVDEFDLYNDNKKKCLDSIFSHTGSFLINVNGGDFSTSQSFEAFNLIFTNIKTLHDNGLISFDNSKMHPVSYKEDNTPVYSMDFSTNFFLQLKKVISIEEIVAKDYQDVFEYPTKRIFNFEMLDKSIITVGLHE